MSQVMLPGCIVDSVLLPTGHRLVLLGFANANSVPTTSMDLPTKRCMPRIRNTKMRRTPFRLVNKKLERLCNKPEVACVRKVRFQNPVESDTSDTVAGSDSDSDWEGMSVDAGMEGKKETALPRGENLDMGTTASALPAITATATSFVMTATAAIFVPKSKKETTHPNFINWVLVEGLEREIYSCPGHYERLGDFFTAFGCNVSNVDIELQADGTMTTGTAWVVLSDDESVSKAVALDGIEDDLIDGDR